MLTATFGLASRALADCPAAPIGSTDDLVISFLAANGTQVSASSLLTTSVKEGMLVYDVTEKTLKLCDGDEWISAGSGTGVAGLDKQVQFNDDGELAGAENMLWHKDDNILDVTGTVTSNVLRIKPTGTGSLPPPEGMGGGASAAGTVTGVLQFRAPDGSFAANDTGLVWNDDDVRLGIGTADPQSALQVGGGVQIGDDVAACPGASNEKLGTVRFNTGVLQICLAGGWSGVASGSEVDPKIGTLTAGDWCTTDGTQVICDTDAPVTVEDDPQVGATDAGKWCVGDGDSVECATDPLIGTLTGGKWCTTDGNTVTCSADPPGGVSLLSGLTDVDVTGIANGKALVYNSTSSKWEPQAISGGGSASGSAAVITYQLAAGSNGGTAVAGAWTQLPLNTEVLDSGNITTLSSNQFTLPAGSYSIRAYQVYFGQGGIQQSFRVRLRNITDGSTAALSATCRLHIASGESVNDACPLNGIVTITGTKTFEMQYYAQTAMATYGLGASVSSSGEVEKYGEVIIEPVNGGGGGSTTLASLTDVSTTGIANGKALVYNSTSSKWEPQTISGGGSGPASGMWSATSTGQVENTGATGPTMQDIPGLSITFTLAEDAKVLAIGNGSLRTDAAGGTPQAGLAFIVDGTVQGHGQWGQQIEGLDGSSEAHAGFTITNAFNLTAGSHTIKLGAAPWGDLHVCAEGGGSLVNYKQCRLQLIALYDGGGGGGGSSQWTDVAGGINYAGGKVGIGAASPINELHVSGAAAAISALVQNTQADSIAQFTAANDARAYSLRVDGGDNFKIRDVTAAADRITIDTGGNVGIGTTSPGASAKLEVSSTTQGFLPPRLTTAQRNAIASPAEGLVVYNSTTKSLEFYNGSAWIVPSATPYVVNSGSYRTWSNGGYATSCNKYINPDTGYSYSGATGDGIYRIDPDGAGAIAPLDVYCDMTTDGGGWTLVHKSSGASSADRTDSGTNVFSLTDPTLNSVAIFPRTTINAISTEFRTVANNGWKLFWKNCPYYATDNHSGVSCSATQVKLNWGANYAAGSVNLQASHAPCISSGSEHVCVQRWCCGSPNEGIWWNGGSYTSSVTRPSTGWAR